MNQTAGCYFHVCLQVFKYFTLALLQDELQKNMQDFINVFYGFMMLHLHQTFFQSSFPVVQQRDGAIYSENKVMSWKMCLGVSPHKQHQWHQSEPISFMRLCGLEEIRALRNQVYQELDFVMCMLLSVWNT